MPDDENMAQEQFVEELLAKGRSLPEAQAIVRAGRALAEATEELESRDPHEAALAAHRPDGPSVDELEARIREWQAAG